MSWLLGLGDRLVPGAVLFVLFDSGLAYGALISLLYLKPRAAWTAVAAVLVFAALPQLLIFQGIVWKDVLFADAGVAAFVALAHAAVRWKRRPLRLALIAASVLAATLAALTRQNGLLLIPCAATALGALAWRDGPRSGLAHAAAYVAACAILGWGASSALASRAEQASGAFRMVQQVQMYDLVGALKHDPKLELTLFEREAPAVLALIRQEGLERYTPVNSDPISHWEPLWAASDAKPGVLGRQWRELVLRHPLAYLAQRARVFAWLVLSPDPSKLYFVQAGVEGPDNALAELHIKPREDARDDALLAYANAFMNARLLHPVFIVIDALCLWGLLRRRRPADLPIAALIVAAGLFASSFFVMSVAADYRYLYLVDLTAMAAGLYVLADPPWSTSRRRR